MRAMLNTDKTIPSFDISTCPKLELYALAQRQRASATEMIKEELEEHLIAYTKLKVTQKLPVKNYLYKVYLNKVLFSVPIRSFSHRATEDFFTAGVVPRNLGWRSLVDVVRRKLDMLHYAHCLDDLKSPPGNRLENLKGDWKGWHSVRINDQWRIVFLWTQAGPSEVAVVDYH